MVMVVVMVVEAARMIILLSFPRDVDLSAKRLIDGGAASRAVARSRVLFFFLSLEAWEHVATNCDECSRSEVSSIFSRAASDRNRTG